MRPWHDTCSCPDKALCCDNKRLKCLSEHSLVFWVQCKLSIYLCCFVIVVQAQIISLHAYFVNNLLLIDFDYPSVARKCLGDTTRKSRIETVLKSGLREDTIFSLTWQRIHIFSSFTRNNKLLVSLGEKSLKITVEKINLHPSQNKIHMIKKKNNPDTPYQLPYII